MIFSFIRPIFLIFLMLVPLLILIHFFTLKRKRTSALKFANFEAIARVKGIDLISKNLSVLIVTAVIMLLLILALSGLTYHTSVQASSFSFVLAIDASNSMSTEDIPPSRIEVAKETASSFVDSSPFATKIGVVSFSGNSFIESDLTQDKVVVKQAISDISLTHIGGTDLYEAVLTSTNMLQNEDSKAVILLSDGQINVGTADDLVNYANQHNVIVNTIGIGTTQGGQTSQGGLSKLDEQTLQSIAYSTDGKYFKAEDRAQLEEAFRELHNLKLKKVSLDLSPYLIIASLVLFLFQFVLINTRYKTLP